MNARMHLARSPPALPLLILLAATQCAPVAPRVDPPPRPQASAPPAPPAHARHRAKAKPPAPPPKPLSPRDGETLYAHEGEASVRLAWTPLSGQHRARYFVDVRKEDRPGAAILSSYVDRPETVLHLPAEPAWYQWRPYVVEPDKRSYSVGAWSRFHVEPAAASPGPAVGDAALAGTGARR